MKYNPTNQTTHKEKEIVRIRILRNFRSPVDQRGPEIFGVYSRVSHPVDQRSCPKERSAKDPRATF